jgi:peptidoglycan/xylan/chitin deacetylase (PgdA/CDA1 family)
MLAAGFGGLGAACAALAYGVRSPTSSWIAPSVYRGCRDRRSIALTFDDGPSESTPRILEILARYRAPATFFLCGANVLRLPSIARTLRSAGHEIGNHTYSHDALHFRAPAAIYRELFEAQRAIEAECGVTPRLFRAPFGIRWFGLRSAQHRLGLTGVMWSVIGLDWKWPGARVAERVLKRSGPGAVICLHDGRGIRPDPDISATLEALERAIPQWIDRGFQFETVTQILCKTS